MTLREFMENLNELIKENPETLDMEVVTSRDDEGNGFNRVYFTPSKGIYEDNDFIPFGSYEDYERNECDTNAVCIN